LGIQSIYPRRKSGLEEGCFSASAHEGCASLPHAYILLKTEKAILLRPSFKPKMETEELFFNQDMLRSVHYCRTEVALTIIIMNVIFALLICTTVCCCGPSNKRVERLEQKNRTLKKIIFTAMESGILRMMDHEELHED